MSEGLAQVSVPLMNEKSAAGPVSSHPNHKKTTAHTHFPGRREPRQAWGKRKFQNDFAICTFFSFNTFLHNSGPHALATEPGPGAENP